MSVNVVWFPDYGHIVAGIFILAHEVVKKPKAPCAALLKLETWYNDNDDLAFMSYQVLLYFIDGAKYH